MVCATCSLRPAAPLRRRGGAEGVQRAVLLQDSSIRAGSSRDLPNCPGATALLDLTTRVQGPPARSIDRPAARKKWPGPQAYNISRLVNPLRGPWHLGPRSTRCRRPGSAASLRQGFFRQASASSTNLQSANGVTKYYNSAAGGREIPVLASAYEWLSARSCVPSSKCWL